MIQIQISNMTDKTAAFESHFENPPTTTHFGRYSVMRKEALNLSISARSQIALVV